MTRNQCLLFSCGLTDYTNRDVAHKRANARANWATVYCNSFLTLNLN